LLSDEVGIVGEGPVGALGGEVGGDPDEEDEDDADFARTWSCIHLLVNSKVANMMAAFGTERRRCIPIPPYSPLRYNIKHKIAS